VAIRVFLVDDHEVVRAGLRSLLESEDDIEVVGEAANVQQALTRVPLAAPDVAILDVRLPDGSGVEVCRQIRSDRPETVCLMLTSYADDEALLAAVLAGASGYVLKEIGGSDIVADVRAVSEGKSLLDPGLAKRVLERLHAPPAEDKRLASLTAQERKILDRIAHGETNRQIADGMFLAEKTVKNYVSNLLAKMGMHRRTEAAIFATRLSEQKKRSQDS
jgi:two-component system response regulator DevR